MNRLLEISGIVILWIGLTIFCFSCKKGPTLPSLTTTSVSEITQETASSGGNVTDDGGEGVSARGVCWSTTQNPTTGNNKTTDGSGTGIFTSNLTGLTPGYISVQVPVHHPNHLSHIVAVCEVHLLRHGG